MSPFEPVRAAAEAAGQITAIALHALAGLFRRPLALSAWIREMDRVGVRSLGVAGVTTVFTGMVLALQTAYSLPGLGIKYYIGSVVSKSLVRELGPVLVALIVGGRIGAGMTAELGSMKVTEQIDALRALGADPVRRLVVPKLGATLVMLPALTVIGDLLGIFGGLLIAVFELGLTPAFYLNDVLTALTVDDVASGVGKSWFFAFFITVVACRNGFHVTGGADGVGRATTNTVVMASILILMTDFFLTKLFYLIG